jgi:hypothetical protein
MAGHEGLGADDQACRPGEVVPVGGPGSWRLQGGRRRSIAVLTVLATAGAALTLTAGTAQAAAPQFPNNIVVFPERDFITVEGYQDHVGQLATIEVTRPGAGVIGSARAEVAEGDVAFEINHPGGVCWGAGTGLPVTPDIRPGDTATISFDGPGAGNGDDVTAQDAYVETVNITGDTTFTVTAHVGAGIEPANLEQRIVNPALTALVGKRDIRAVVGDGTLVPSPKSGTAGSYSSKLEVSGSTATATYVFDDAGAARVAATGGGGRLLSWQQTDADGNRQGITIAEFGEVGGPGMGGCPNGPLQSGPAGPTSLAAANVAGGVRLTWTPAVAVPGTPAIIGYEATAVSPVQPNGERNTVGRRITGVGATGTTIAGVNDTWDIEVVSLSSAGRTTPPLTAIPVTDITAPAAVTASPAGGVYATPQDVTLRSEVGAEIYFTSDGSDPLLPGGLTGNTATRYTGPVRVDQPTPSILRFAAVDPSGNVSPTGEQTYTIDAGQVPAPDAPTVTGVEPGDASATVRFTPASTGTPATGFRVQALQDSGTGSSVVGSVDVPAAASSAVVTGLTNGATYSFRVIAFSTGGESPPSAQSAPVVPQARPSANAGADQTVLRDGRTVTLTGTATNGTAQWTQLSGPAVTLTPGPDGTTATFPYTSRSLPVAGTAGNPGYTATNAPLVFRLTVTGPAGTAQDEVTISPQPETLSGVTAEYRTGTPQWRIAGTTSLPVGHTVAVVLGPDLRGRLITSSATVDATGAITFPRPATPAAIAGSTVSLVSEYGGERLSVPVTVRR